MKSNEAKTGAKPVWGRAGLIVFLGSLLLTYIGTASNIIPGSGWVIGLLIAMGAGIVCPIVSLARRERKGAAITTLVLSLGLPFTLYFGFAVFFEYFYVP